MNYKTELNKMIVRSGRKRIWISKQLKIDPSTFWRKANGDTFTDEEKKSIENLLS